MRSRIRKSISLTLALLLVLSAFVSLSAPAFGYDEIKTVKVGFFAFPGYHELKDGVRSGYGYDFLILLQRYTRLNYEFIGYESSWEEMQSMLLEGKIDLVTSARKTAEREAQFDFSEPIGTNKAQINVRIDDERFIPGDHAALEGITIGILTGNSRNADLEKYAQEKGFTYIPKAYETAEELSAALMNGSVDAIATSSLRKAKGEKTIAEFAPEEFYILVRKGDTDLLNELNYGIAQMDLNEGNWRDNLYYDHYATAVDTVLSFTPRETEFIRAVQSGEKVIRAAAQPDNAPYSFVENGRLTGIIPDYFAHLMEMAGLKYTVLIAEDRDEFRDWALQDIPDVIMDCRDGSSLSAQYASGIATDPYMVLTTSRVCRKGFKGTIHTVAAVEPQQTDHIGEDIAADAVYLTVSNSEEAMQAVKDGKADACYVYTYMAEKFINADPDSVLQATILKNPAYDEYIRINPNAPHELCSILNKCIRADASGVLDEYVKKYTAVTYESLSLIQFLKLNPQYTFIGAAVLALVIVLGAYMVIRSKNAKMKTAQLEKELQQQKKLEESLTFTNFFLDTYISAYYVDLGSQRYKVYKRTEALDRKYPAGGNYFDTLVKYISQDVHPDDREELLNAVRPERVKELLRENREYTHSFRSITDGRERILRLQVIRGADADQAAFGFADITEELHEQQMRLLGAVPLSPDILGKANIGLWAFELDEGKAPRMYGDDTMLGLLGLTHEVSPEETYHAWYDHIDESSYGLVTDAVEKMSAGEHAEVQYPWHAPDGETLIVRCGGVLNPEYKKGIRIEGTHQNVTEVLHFDEEKQRREQEDLALMLITTLSDSYTSMYYIIPETGEYQLITKDAEYANKVETRLFHGGSFYEDTAKSTPLVIYPEDRAKVKPLESRAGMEAAFGNDDVFTVDYRLLIDNAPVWYRVKAVRIHEAENSTHYAIGVMNISREIQQEAQLRKNREIIEILASEYTSVYYIDLTTDELTPYTMNESTESAFGKIFRSGISYSEAFRMYVDDQVLPEDKENMLTSGSLRNIIRELRGKKTFLTTYRAANGHFSEMKFVKVGDETGKPVAVALGFADKDEELRAKQEAETVRQRNIDIIEILASEYSSVYYIDLTTDELDPYTMNEETESEFGQIFRSGIHYSDAFRMYVENLVYADDKAMMIRAGSIYNILRELADKKTFITTYRSDNNGEPHYCEMKFVKVGDEENPRAVALGFADKDEEIHAEMEQKAIAARDAAVISGLSDDFGCVVYVDKKDGSEVHYRFDPFFAASIPGWEKITCFTERLKALADTLVHPDDKAFFLSAEVRRERILDIVKKEGVYYHNFRVLNNGETVYYQLKIVKDEYSDDHVIIGFRNVDMNVKREMEYQEKLEAANKSKTDFLFNMSHDIRTPMNAIIGFTQMAKKHIADQDRTMDSLNKIEASGNHLLELINEVLDMSRVEAGKLHSEMKTVNVTETAERLVMICRESAAQRNISMTFRAKNIVHPTVIADELHINQIVMNILGNAVKYTGPGGSVRYTVEEDESNVEGYGKYILTIEDTGIGMSREFLRHIYESFSREDNVSTSQIQGTGLGMSIVKRLVDYMDGTIDIESEQGKGTKVTVVLFMKLAETDEVTAQDGERPSVILTGRKALLVEDNELNREIATEILEEQGITVESAVNGIDAVDRVKQRGAKFFDFILMDIQMPLMDGYEATRKIRKLPDTEDLPIIALSANAFEEDKKRSIESGMNDHVSKPIVMAELMGALARYVK